MAYGLLASLAQAALGQGARALRGGGRTPFSALTGGGPGGGGGVRRRRKALTHTDMSTALTIASAISKKAAENFILMRVRGG